MSSRQSAWREWEPTAGSADYPGLRGGCPIPRTGWRLLTARVPHCVIPHGRPQGRHSNGSDAELIRWGSCGVHRVFRAQRGLPLGPILPRWQASVWTLGGLEPACGGCVKPLQTEPPEQLDATPWLAQGEKREGRDD